jgi:hypothetical protein
MKLDRERRGFKLETESRNHISYVNTAWEPGRVYRIGAAPDGEGGWGVYVQRQKIDRKGGQEYWHVEADPNMTTKKSKREKRYNAIQALKSAVDEHGRGSRGMGGGDFDMFGGGRF